MAVRAMLSGIESGRATPCKSPNVRAIEARWEAKSASDIAEEEEGLKESISMKIRLARLAMDPVNEPSLTVRRTDGNRGGC